jgi:micrococcal nuclease
VNVCLTQLRKCRDVVMWCLLLLSHGRLLPISQPSLAVVGALVERGARAARAAVTTAPLTSAATSFAAGVAVGAVAAPRVLYATALYATAEDIPASRFRERATLTARVVKVTDGDTFRVSHLPVLAGLRRSDEGKKLSERTLQIRIAAIDCPETAKFGNAGQQFGDEATDWKAASCASSLARDQYQRAVSTVTYRRGLWRRDLSEELLKHGFATIYRQGGAEYDGPIERWERLEAAAQRKRIGIWSTEGGVDPAEYKRKLKKG